MDNKKMAGTGTKLAPNHTTSTTTNTTSDGRTVVDVHELLSRPNVKKIIDEISKTPLVPDPLEKTSSKE